MSLFKGRNAEQSAEEFLNNNHLITVTRNFNCKLGEIDLIMLDNNELVFVEVRARKSNNYGTAAESISQSKQKKICKTAKFFLLQNRNYQNHNCRFDVVELNDFGKASSNIEWIKDAFWLADSFSIL